jgi:DNA-binding CsgD family transcriptional regulator
MTAPATAATVFVGRRAELDALDRALDAVRHGRPHVIVIQGPPGVGKTTLLSRFIRHGEGVRTLRSSGEETEASLRYGVLDQLMRVAGAGESGFLSERHADRNDHVSAGGRLLDAISALEAKGPVVIAVDDAQWADAPSLRALLFATRRLVEDRVMIVLTVREHEPGNVPEGFVRLAEAGNGLLIRLGPLGTAELRELAAGIGIELSPRAAHRLQVHTSGNPLHATAMLRELPEAHWSDPDADLPAPRSLFALVSAQLAKCSPNVRALVEAAAVHGNGCCVATAAALAGVDDPLDVLEEAVDSGLLAAGEAHGERILEFPHPLIQAAVKQQIGPARRARLHASAAVLVDDEECRLRHRVAAAAGPDAELADALEDFARREGAKGAWTRAANAFAAAGRLSRDPSKRGARLLSAADALVWAGDFERARAMAEQTSDVSSGPRRDGILGRVALAVQRPQTAHAIFSRAWTQRRPGDAHVTGDIARGMAFVSLLEMRGEDTVLWARRAIALFPPGDAARADAEALLSLGLAYCGRLDEGEASLDAALDTVPQDSGLPVRVIRGWLRLARDDISGARDELATAAVAAERFGALDIAALGYAQLARAQFAAGDWDAAVVQADRALTIVGEIEYAYTRPLVWWAAAQVPAARGDWALAAECRRQAAADAGGTLDRGVSAAMVRAMPAAARGEHDVVIAALEPLATRPSRPGGLDEPGFWPWHDLYAQALVAVGRLDEADAFLRVHEERAAARSLSSARGRLARVRGGLEAANGRFARAEVAFVEAIERFEAVGMPFEQAGSELAHGEFLRRRGQRRAAAARLRAARETLSALGALPYVERCDRALAACGLTPAKRHAARRQELTPQERTVARLVTSGRTNREVAAELLVSVKTVEVHLTRIYAKLGVSSRAQLTAQAREALESDNGASS